MAAIIAAYRRGASADFLQAKINERWGPLWTVPSCSSHAMERASRQFIRSRAEAVRHYRLARLRRPSEARGLEVVVMTQFPERTQVVLDLESGHTLSLKSYLEDAASAVLEAAFHLRR